MAKFLSVMRRIDDSWLGDVIATICLFGTSYAMWIIGCAVGL